MLSLNLWLLHVCVGERSGGQVEPLVIVTFLKKHCPGEETRWNGRFGFQFPVC